MKSPTKGRNESKHPLRWLKLAGFYGFLGDTEENNRNRIQHNDIPLNFYFKSILFNFTVKLCIKSGTQFVSMPAENLLLLIIIIENKKVRFGILCSSLLQKNQASEIDITATARLPCNCILIGVTSSLLKEPAKRSKAAPRRQATNFFPNSSSK